MGSSRSFGDERSPAGKRFRGGDLADAVKDLRGDIDDAFISIEAEIAGLDWKASVRAASIAAVTLASLDAGQALDGVTLAAGDRVLLKNQAAGAENGIWVIQADGTPPVRAVDADADAEVTSQMAVSVDEGTIQNTTWRLTTDAPDVGTDALAFTQLTQTAAGAVAAVEAEATLDLAGDVTIATGKTLGIGLNPASYVDEKNNLVVGSTSGHNGMTIVSSTVGVSTLQFRNNTSVNDIEGWIDYSGNTRTMRLGTNGLNTAVTIASNQAVTCAAGLTAAGLTTVKGTAVPVTTVAIGGTSNTAAFSSARTGTIRVTIHADIGAMGAHKFALTGAVASTDALMFSTSAATTAVAVSQVGIRVDGIYDDGADLVTVTVSNTDSSTYAIAGNAGANATLTINWAAL